MKQKIKNRIRKIKNRIEKLQSQESSIAYDNMLDEAGKITIASLSFDPSYVLKKVDPVAYKCGLNDYNDEEIAELENELAELEAELASDS